MLNTKNTSDSKKNNLTVIVVLRRIIVIVRDLHVGLFISSRSMRLRFRVEG